MTTTHHAVLLIGERESGVAKALAFFDMREGDAVNNPDLQTLALEQFGIDEARALKHAASMLPVRDAVRTFILACERITGEAQNALLKLFEDPPATARFALVVPREDILIPTLRSRLAKEATRTQGGDTTAARSFLAASYAERLKEIAMRTKEKDDAWARILLDGLEKLLYEQGEKAYGALHEVAFVRTYAGTRGSSTKMLLEHLALSLPPQGRA